jgi:RNA polymerase sigma factor (sigma-70 family)
MSKILSDEQTKEAIRLWQQNHDEDAFALLLEDNQGLIRKAAYLYEWNEYDDVISTCYEGFVSALNYFDLNEPIHNFFNYATKCIRQKLFSEFIDRKYSVKACHSLDETYDDDDKLNLYNKMESTDDIGEFVYYDSLHELMMTLLDTLTLEERDIVIKYYGLKDDKESTLTEIASSKNYNIKRASFLKKRAMSKLAKNSELYSFVCK